MSYNYIYSRKNFRIIKIKDNVYIVYNTSRSFKNGHTHVNNYFIAKAIIEYCVTGKFSTRTRHLAKNKYIMRSIERVIDKE